ncbi:MAG: TonB-dependent receptor [Moheibacter sp.]
MRQNSTLFKALFLFLLVGGTLTYAQVDPDETEELSDSTEYSDDEFVLKEAVIVAKGIIDLEEDRKTPVAVSTIKRQEIQDKAIGNVEFPEIMKNTPSVYVAGQSGGFGDSKMFLRGFDQSNTAYLLNGQPINGMEDGNMYWSNWSSMTDVANAIQVQRGLGSSKLAISSVGGTVNIVTKATERKQGGMVRLVMGNDSYVKGTVAYDTGLKGKWGFSMLLDYWQGHRKFARGTAGQGQSYFFSVGFKPNNHHNFNFMLFGAPQWHDQNYSKQFTTRYWDNGNIRTPGYDITGTKGNSNYGFYNGEALNIRKNYYHKPVMNLNWDWNINSQASLSTVLYASMGRGGGTGPWGNGPDYINENFNGAYNSNGEINWDFIESNYNSTIANGIGSGYNGMSIRSSVNNHFWYGAVSNFNYDINENWAFNVGADLRFYKGDHFRQLVDLVGLKGWSASNENRADDYVVSETFDANPWASLFNFADEDQRINYDNSEKINYQGGFGQIEFKSGGFSVFAQGAISNQFYQKMDRWNYVGEAKSEKVNKLGYNVKGGLAYNFASDHTIFGNAGFYSRQPFLDNIFASNTVDLYEPEVDNEEITGFEVGYRYDSRKVKVNVNLYHTEWANRFLSMSNGPETTLLLTDIAQIHKGVEVDFSTKVARKWTLRGYGSYGDWKYDGVTPTRIRNNDTFETVDGENIDLTGTYVGDAAQFTFGLGTQFDVCRGFSFDFDMNYYASLYGTVDAEDVVDSSLAGEVYQSEQLAPYAIVDGGVTYEFKLGNQKIRFRGNVKNLFNTQYTAQYDGYGYVLGLGRTYNAGLQVNF